MEINGFSKKPINLEPTKAPTIDPRIIERRFLLDIWSVVDFRSQT
jgi:hypothetical protein